MTITTKTKKHQATDDNFAARLQRLQDIVNLLEHNESPLEEAISLYQEGVALAKTCQTQLDTARHDIEILNADGEITPLSDQSAPQDS